jgi:hypothetical protein
MARKKETPKPLFEVKHEFYASLDHDALQEAVFLQQAVRMALRIEGAIKPQVAAVLQEKLDAFEAALLTREDWARGSRTRDWTA